MTLLYMNYPTNMNDAPLQNDSVVLCVAIGMLDDYQ